MHKLESQIRRAIAEERWFFTKHARHRLAERSIEGWQVIDGVGNGRSIQVRPMARPNPKVLMRQMLADGTPIITVWAYLKSVGSAALITVYYELE